MIEAIAAGKSDNVAMRPELAERLQHVRTGLQGILRAAGAIRSISVLTRSDDGQLVFAVTFEHGANQFSVRLDNAGLVEAFSYGPHLADAPECAFSALPVCAGPIGAELEPGGEGALRHVLAAIAEGRDVTATLSSGTYNESPGNHAFLEQMIQSWGAVKSVTFCGMSVTHVWVYDVAFERAHAWMKVNGVSLDGQQATGLNFRRYDPDIHPTEAESSCGGARTVTGVIVAPSIVAVKQFFCRFVYFGVHFGGRGWGTLVTSRPVEGGDDLIVPINIPFIIPINIAFRNPDDATKVRLWTKAVVTGQFFLVDEFGRGVPRDDLKNRTQYLIVRDAEIEQDPSAIAIITDTPQERPPP